MSRELLAMVLDALTTCTNYLDRLPTWSACRHEANSAHAAIAALRSELAQPAPAVPAVPNDAALNTLAKMFHSGEEVEGDDGAAMMVDMALWNEGCEALESLIGEGDNETLASSAVPAVQPKIIGYVSPRELESGPKPYGATVDVYRERMAGWVPVYARGVLLSASHKEANMADNDEMIRVQLVMQRDGRMNTKFERHRSIEPIIAQTLLAGLLQRALGLYAREGYDEDESGGPRNG